MTLTFNNQVEHTVNIYFKKADEDKAAPSGAIPIQEILKEYEGRENFWRYLLTAINFSFIGTEAECFRFDDYLQSEQDIMDMQFLCLEISEGLQID